MAVVNKKPAPAAAAAKAAAPAATGGVASSLPDEMIAGGLMDDFDGTMNNARFVPWDYNGTLDHDILAVAIDITPEEGEMFTQHYSAGDLDNFVPSKDGINPVQEGDEDPTGPFAVRVGKKEGLSNNSNYATFMMAALEAGLPRERVVAAGGALSFFDGISAHFNRVPQKKRSGIVSQVAADDTKKRNNDILVITEIKSLGETAGKKTAAAKPATPAKPAAPAPAKAAAPAAAAPAPAALAEGESLDDQIVAVVLPSIVEAGEEGLAKAKLATLVLNAFEGAVKAKAIKRVGEADFLENRDEWGYDPESGLLYGVVAE